MTTNKQLIIESFIKQDKKKYHPDLHSAVEQLYADCDVEESNGMISFMPHNFISKEAEDRFNGARERFKQRNIKQLNSLKSQLDRVEAEMRESEGARQRSQQKQWDNQDAGLYWKPIAKRLGIHKYLTASGGMSRAKLSKRSQSEIEAAVEIYNSKYIPAVKEASSRVKYAKNTPEDSDAIARYNQLVPTYNDLKQQIHSLSGCLGI